MENKYLKEFISCDLPENSITCISGSRAEERTIFAVEAAKDFIKRGEKVAFFDVDNQYNLPTLQVNGLDPSMVCYIDASYDNYYLMEQIIYVVKEHNIKLLIIDPVSNLFSFSSNKAVSCANFYSDVMHLAIKFGLTVIFTSNGDFEKVPASIRYTSLWINVERMLPSAAHKFTITKSRYNSREGKELYLDYEYGKGYQAG